ncbi:hypothetical protein [Lacinutrix sp. MEBiC02404]
MKKITLTILLLVVFNFISAQTAENKDYESISFNTEKLNEGKEKLNIFFYKILGETKTELKKQKNKLKEVSESTRYSSKVTKEKETLKILNEIDKIESVLIEVRSKIASEKYSKAYHFQKAPESVINHFFAAFQNNDYSKFDYLKDPYGEYSEDLNFLSLMSVFTTYLKEKNSFDAFKNEIEFEVINTRIENDKAFVLVKTKNEEAVTNSYRNNSNSERLFTLITREGYWYLIDIEQ